MNNAHRRRRALKRKGMKPKLVSEVLQSLSKAQFDPATQLKQEEKLVKAKCSRLRNRCHVIGSSVFKFDKDGICEVDQNKDPMAYQSWPLLLKMNGVEEIVDPPEETEVAVAGTPEPAPPPEPEPEPESTPEPDMEGARADVAELMKDVKVEEMPEPETVFVDEGEKPPAAPEPKPTSSSKKSKSSRRKSKKRDS